MIMSRNIRCGIIKHVSFFSFKISQVGEYSPKYLYYIIHGNNIDRQLFFLLLVVLS